MSIPFTLRLRAFINVARKEKAESHATRLFRGVATKVEGRYWKNKRLWEVSGVKECEHDTDQSALWETLKYFRDISAQWTIVSGPNDDTFETVVAAVYEGASDDLLSWCSFELLRARHVEKPQGA